ncbi:BlaI/MecI/CopY family transcriptional regulator [bacterium]|nr:BlaI/MecI/CopY family transcriptional regulator [bacterium]
MADKQKLTPAEWEIMEAVWDLNKPASVRDVLEHPNMDGKKAYTTLQTLMNILVTKKLLKAEKIGLVKFYRPLTSRNEMVKAEMSSMIQRVFNGSTPAMANFLLKTQQLKAEDIEEMKQILHEKENQLRDDHD